MRRLLWVFGWSAVTVWSLMAMMAYGLVDVVGHLAMRNADMFSADPETVEWIFRTFGWLRSFSVSVVMVVWGFVSLAILAVPWLFDRFAAPTTMPRGSGQAPVREGVIDLAPGEYSVGPSQSARPGTVPRIGPRG